MSSYEEQEIALALVSLHINNDVIDIELLESQAKHIT